MTQEDKELLLKDLSARLPYKCKCKASKGITHWHKLTLNPETIDKIIDDYYDEIKPYLRPMDSMTEEERYEIQEILGKDIEIFDDFINIIDSSRKRFSFLELQALLDWLNAHHFDFRGLIKKGLALEVPEGMYKTE